MVNENKYRPPTLHDFLRWKFRLRESSTPGGMNCLLQQSGKICKQWMGDFAFFVSCNKAWKWNSKLFIEQLKISCSGLPAFWYESAEKKRRKIFSVFSVAYKQKKINGLSPHVACIKTGEGVIRVYSDLATQISIYKIKLRSLPSGRLPSRLRTELIGLSLAYPTKKIVTVGIGNSDVQVLPFNATSQHKDKLMSEIEEFLRHLRRQESMQKVIK